MLRSALPARRQARLLLVGTFGSALGNGMTLPFLYVYLHEVRGLDATYVGLTLAWIGVVTLCAAGPIGTLMDHLGVRGVLIPLYVIGAAAVSSWWLVHQIWQAFLVATFVAAASATFNGMNTLISSVTDDHDRHRMYSLNFMLLNAGIAVGGVVSGFIADVHRPASFHVLYTVDGISWLVPAIVLLALRGVGQRLAERHEVQQAGGYREVLADRPFRRLVLLQLLFAGVGYAQIEVGYPAFATTVGGVSTHVIAWGLVANTLVIVGAQLTVTNRLRGRSRSLALVVAGTVVALSWAVLGIGCFAGRGGLALPAIGVIACSAIFGLAETIYTPLTPALTNTLARDELRGRYNSMGSLTWGITAIVGPLTAAPLIGHDLGGVWLALVICGALGAALVARSLHRMLTPEQDGRHLVSASSPDLLGV